METLLMNLLGGAIGGNVAGGLMKKLSLGPVLNSVVGIIGGGLGGQLLGSAGILSATGGSAMDVSSILGNIASSGVGGAVLLAIVGLIKKAITKS